MEKMESLHRLIRKKLRKKIIDFLQDEKLQEHIRKNLEKESAFDTGIGEFERLVGC